MASDPWAASVSDFLVAALQESLASAERVAFAVPGGRTVVDVLPSVFEADIPWDRVTLVLCDDRWVPISDERSNERLIRSLMSGMGTAPRLLGLKTDDAEPALALPHLEAQLAELPLPFAAVLLGMGEDGHIASLFPGAQIPADASVVAGQSPDGLDRISLGPALLLNASQIVLAISNAEKARVLETAQEPGPVSEFPVRWVLQQDQTPVQIFSR